MKLEAFVFKKKGNKSTTINLGVWGYWSLKIVCYMLAQSVIVIFFVSIRLSFYFKILQPIAKIDKEKIEKISQ